MRQKSENLQNHYSFTLQISRETPANVRVLLGPIAQAVDVVSASVAVPRIQLGLRFQLLSTLQWRDKKAAVDFR